jgi:wobble nucleotide-excising tRNase
MANALGRGSNEITLNQTFRKYQEQDTNHTTRINDLEKEKNQMSEKINQMSEQMNKIHKYLILVSEGLVVQKVNDNAEIQNIEYK